MFEGVSPLSIDDAFTFECSRRVACFNECCRDLNQFLTPYDILRLKKNLGLTSSAFLEQYTLQHSGPESGLPMITLKGDPSSKLACPFVTKEGCSVYKDRPSSCRTYPLARVVSRSRETNELKEQFMLIHEPHCFGFKEQKSQTVREWLDGQEIFIYNEMNDKLMEIISLKNQLLPGPLDLKSNHIFHLACYDTDNFKALVFEKGLLDEIEIDSALMESARRDDVALLDLGLMWIKKALFGV